jgi:hypothetical protein
VVWIERFLEPRLRRAAQTRPVTVLTGPRQTGKTSLLRRAFPQYRFVSLDLPSLAELAEQDPSTFLAQHPPPVLIDEVQYAPRLFRHLKVAVDRRRTEAGQFLLTGSHRFTLMQEITDSLAGRVEVLEIEPLSIQEILAAQPGWPLEALLLRGGYPELYQNRELESFSFYLSYVATYLERDVRSLLSVASLRDFERFVRACALRSAQLLNKAELARDAGVSPATANQWLGVLQASGQVVLLEPWFSHRLKSLVKSPKLYLSDTGLLCTLLNIQTLDELLKSPLRGAIWETFVFAELRKREAASRRHWSIHFFHDRVREVDFVLDRGGRFELYDAKWTEHPTSSEAAALQHLRRLLGSKNVATQAVVCRAPNAYPLDAATTALPLDRVLTP